MSEHSGRYHVTAMWPDMVPQSIGASDNPTIANRLMIAAFHEGAIRCQQTDTTPDADKARPVTDEERANIAAIIPRTRNFD